MEKEKERLGHLSYEELSKEFEKSFSQDRYDRAGMTQDLLSQYQSEQQEKLDNLYEELREEVGSSTMDLVSEIVELEILLEKESNK